MMALLTRYCAAAFLAICIIIQLNVEVSAAEIPDLGAYAVFHRTDPRAEWRRYSLFLSSVSLSDKQLSHRLVFLYEYRINFNRSDSQYEHISYDGKIWKLRERFSEDSAPLIKDYEPVKLDILVKHQEDGAFEGSASRGGKAVEYVRIEFIPLDKLAKHVAADAERFNQLIIAIDNDIDALLGQIRVLRGFDNAVARATAQRDLDLQRIRRPLYVKLRDQAQEIHDRISKIKQPRSYE
jgi:hypothetical protein